MGLVGLLRSYALDNRTRYHHRWLGDLWTRSQDPTPEHFIARGWDDCLGVLERLQEALRSPSPETDPCLATGDGWIAEEALASGLLCFLLFPDEPVTALRRAACSMRRLRLHRLPGKRLRGRVHRGRRLADGVGGPDRAPERTRHPRGAVGPLIPLTPV